MEFKKPTQSEVIGVEALRTKLEIELNEHHMNVNNDDKSSKEPNQSPPKSSSPTSLPEGCILANEDNNDVENKDQIIKSISFPEIHSVDNEPVVYHHPTPIFTQNITDTAILRFLRGRKYVEDKAFRAILRHIQWREENLVSSIRPDDIMEEINKKKVIVRGSDKLQRACVYVLVRNHRSDDRNIDTMKKFIIHSLEEAIKNSNPNHEQLILVFDMHQFSLACMDYEVVKVLIEILQFNYPETLGMALILNAPFIFSACWLVIKPWLDPDTVKKVIFASASQLKEYIVAEDIPEEVHLK